jgi:hypothetical protein
MVVTPCSYTPAATGFDCLGVDGRCEHRLDATAGALADQLAPVVRINTKGCQCATGNAVVWAKRTTGSVLIGTVRTQAVAVHLGRREAEQHTTRALKFKPTPHRLMLYREVTHVLRQGAVLVNLTNA